MISIGGDRYRDEEEIRTEIKIRIEREKRGNLELNRNKQRGKHTTAVFVRVKLPVVAVIPAVADEFRRDAAVM